MLERIGYLFLILAFIAWIILLVKGLIQALPEGLIGFGVLIGLGFLLFKVIQDRARNKEDDYYDKNVNK